MPELLTVEGIEVKREAGGSYGVDPVPGTSDGVRLARNCWSNLDPDYNWENDRSGVVTGAMIPPVAALPRGRMVKLEIFAEVKGAGSDIPPEVAELLVACGLPETDGSALWTYGPLTSGTKGSGTVYAYTGGLLWKISGCRGRARLELVAGELAVFHFTIVGFPTADPATTGLAGITYDATEPIAAVNAGLTIGSWAPDWQTMTVDPTGVDAQLLESGNASDGIQMFDFADSNPLVELVARKVPLATYDPYADRKARTSRTLLFTLGPAVAFSRLKILAATVQVMKHQHIDAQGFVGWRLSYRMSAGGTFQFD
jgi:hypothetical protein